jgi:hypothetical protein
MWTKAARRLKLTARTLLGRAAPARAVPAREVPAISAAEVAEARQFFPLDKFFIFGHARSGTTLLARLIRLHPEVHCNYQAHFFSRAPLLESLVDRPEIGDWLGRRSNRWNGGRDLSPLVLRAAADFIMEREARPLGKRIVGDKSPNSLLDGAAVEKLVKVYPDGRLIFIVRDGRDTALSHRFQAFIDTPQSLNAEDRRIRADFIADPQPFLGGERSLFTPTGLRRAAEGWVRNVHDTDAQGQALLSDHYLSLRYEDLLAAPEAELRRLWTFLGAAEAADDLAGAIAAALASNPDADWQQEKAGEIAGPLQKGKAGSWRELFTAADRQLFNAVAGETLRRWRYDLDPEAA